MKSKAWFGLLLFFVLQSHFDCVQASQQLASNNVTGWESQLDTLLDSPALETMKKYILRSTDNLNPQFLLGALSRVTAIHATKLDPTKPDVAAQPDKLIATEMPTPTKEEQPQALKLDPTKVALVAEKDKAKVSLAHLTAETCDIKIPADIMAGDCDQPISHGKFCTPKCPTGMALSGMPPFCFHGVAIDDKYSCKPVKDTQQRLLLAQGVVNLMFTVASMLIHTLRKRLHTLEFVDAVRGLIQLKVIAGFNAVIMVARSQLMLGMDVTATGIAGPLFLIAFYLLFLAFESNDLKKTVEKDQKLCSEWTVANLRQNPERFRRFLRQYVIWATDYHRFKRYNPYAKVLSPTDDNMDRINVLTAAQAELHFIRQHQQRECTPHTPKTDDENGTLDKLANILKAFVRAPKHKDEFQNKANGDAEFKSRCCVVSCGRLKSIYDLDFCMYHFRLQATASSPCKHDNWFDPPRVVFPPVKPGYDGLTPPPPFPSWRGIKISDAEDDLCEVEQVTDVTLLKRRYRNSVGHIASRGSHGRYAYSTVAQATIWGIGACFPGILLASSLAVAFAN